MDEEPNRKHARQALIATSEGLAGEDDEEAMELSMSMGLGADSPAVIEAALSSAAATSLTVTETAGTGPKLGSGLVLMLSLTAHEPKMLDGAPWSRPLSRRAKQVAAFKEKVRLAASWRLFLLMLFDTR